LKLNEIVEKKLLCEKINMYKIYSPKLVQKARPGQFVILRALEHSERIPMSIGHLDTENGLLTMAVQEVGKSTAELATLEKGDALQDLVGPLGNPTPIEKYGTCVLIGGGVGIPPINPINRALKEAGNETIVIIGGRSKEFVIMEDYFQGVADRVMVCTDDGSYGIHGFVTSALEQLIDEGKKIDWVMSVGPVPMMRNVVKITAMNDIPTVVSLNPVMVDGTGMCGSCRVSIGGETKFACVDGPDFDGHLVDFDELVTRQAMYRDKERQAYDRFIEKCRIGLKTKQS
jgi:ferredoxin--NADP+ reductase